MKLPKHEVVTADELARLNVQNYLNKDVPVIFFDRHTPGFKYDSGITVYPEHTFPKVGIVVSINKEYKLNDKWGYLIKYKSPDDNYTKVFFGRTFSNKFGVLTGVLKDRMLAKAKESMVNNIATKLKPTGMDCGSDPEIFVVDENNNMIPSFKFLKGKKDPDVARYNYGEKAYWDGFQAEFETRPSSCLASHTDSVQRGLELVLREARKFNPNAKLTLQNVFHIPQDVLETTENQYVQLGCMPSFNAYNMKGDVLRDGRELDHRSAGGHIHLGLYTKTNKDVMVRMVKALDAILGVACVSLFQKYDDPIRRKYYGLAGEYRLPEHGLEYRVLSNAWLKHPFIMNLVFDVARMAAEVGRQDLLKDIWKATEQETIECINTCDVKKAQEILNCNKDKFIQILHAAYTRNDLNGGMEHNKIERLFKVFIDGMHTVLKSEDIEANWNLTNGKWKGHNEGEGKNCVKAMSIIIKGEQVA